MSDSFSRMPLPLASRRYAQALFDLVQEAGYVKDFEEAFTSFLDILDRNTDLKRLIQSPFFSTKEQVQTLDSICESFRFSDKGAGQIMRNFLRVIVENHRLFALSDILRAFQCCVASFRGEASVHIISAHPLDVHQQEELRVVLADVVGRKILLRLSVDSTILGGLIVRLGSCQIDASLEGKLSSLKLALKKEVS
ncbi:ATP synthase F1 subunit delta [Bartonella melophagi]|uniref:ATP synthase subunit delta n=1 Tax=Bartonella melophagi K-2C TaxID=1094557 RepID=J1K3L4_9HYPH|nr:ATP synthase F1 subunit delta [Bartonella melophagi]EJF92082.1 ATP synthase F1, delta subunit [Bartonella melophagi K-2C]